MKKRTLQKNKRMIVPTTTTTKIVSPKLEAEHDHCDISFRPNPIVVFDETSSEKGLLAVLSEEPPHIPQNVQEDNLG